MACGTRIHGSECCGEIVCPEQPTAIVVTISGVTNSGSCTICNNLNDSFVLTVGTIEFGPELCNGETVLSYCNWSGGLFVLFGCSGSPLMLFLFQQVAGQKYASVKFGNDFTNTEYYWWEKAVSSFSVPVTFTPAHLQTTPPCVPVNTICNWSAATIVVTPI